MRNAELKSKVRSVAPAAGLAACPVHSALRTPHSAFLSSEGQEVGEEPIRPRDSRRQLPEEAEPCVDIRAPAERRDEQAARARRLARIVRLQEGRVGRVPIVSEVQPALLHPPPPVVWPDPA